MKRIVDRAHDFLLNYIKEESICVDFTMGNGQDTLFLAKHCPKGKVIAFDIDQEAYTNTLKKIQAENLNHVELHLCSHHLFEKYVSHYQVGIFNFGFLPHGKSFNPTLLDTSKIAVERALKHLNPKGLLILVLYPGHTEGKQESDYFKQWVGQLDPYYYEVFYYSMFNKENCPYILGIEKKRE